MECTWRSQHARGGGRYARVLPACYSCWHSEADSEAVQAQRAAAFAMPGREAAHTRLRLKSSVRMEELEGGQARAPDADASGTCAHGERLRTARRCITASARTQSVRSERSGARARTRYRARDQARARTHCQRIVRAQARGCIQREARPFLLACARLPSPRVLSQ